MATTHKSGLSEQAFERLIESQGRFLSFIERRVGSRAVAQDILQSAFVRSLERGNDVRDEESVVAWFYRVLRNAIIDHYRQQAAGVRAAEGWAAEVMRQEQLPPEVEQEICRCVSGLLGNLKPEYQQALELVDLEEGTMAALAEKAGITSNNAAVRVHRARQALKREIRAACGACAEHGCLDCRCQPQAGTASPSCSSS